jgi:hypothetical protein
LLHPRVRRKEAEMSPERSSVPKDERYQ